MGFRDHLEEACSEVALGVQRAAAHARCVYKDGEFKGLSYGIGKEEHIRSLLMAELNQTYVVEPEWNLYNLNGKIDGEIDLVGFWPHDSLPSAYQSNHGPAFLLEIKRTWELPDWNKKEKEFVNSIDADMEKLRRAWGMWRKRGGARGKGSKVKADAPHYGVLVAQFTDPEADGSEVGSLLAETFKDAELYRLTDYETDARFRYADDDDNMPVATLSFTFVEWR